MIRARIESDASTLRFLEMGASRLCSTTTTSPRAAPFLEFYLRTNLCVIECLTLAMLEIRTIIVGRRLTNGRVRHWRVCTT